MKLNITLSADWKEENAMLILKLRIVEIYAILIAFRSKFQK